MTDVVKKRVESRTNRPAVGKYIGAVVGSALDELPLMVMEARRAGVRVWVGRNIDSNEVTNITLLPGDDGPKALEHLVSRIEALRKPDGALMPVMQAYETAEAKNFKHPPKDLNEGPFQSQADEALAALLQVVETEGVNAQSMAEALLATKIAVWRTEDYQLALALAFAALGYLLGEEAVS